MMQYQICDKPALWEINEVHPKYLEWESTSKSHNGKGQKNLYFGERGGAFSFSDSSTFILALLIESSGYTGTTFVKE
jgi:hypothetical protein